MRTRVQLLRVGYVTKTLGRSGRTTRRSSKRSHRPHATRPFILLGAIHRCLALQSGAASHWLEAVVSRSSGHARENSVAKKVLGARLIVSHTFECESQTFVRHFPEPILSESVGSSAAAESRRPAIPPPRTIRRNNHQFPAATAAAKSKHKPQRLQIKSSISTVTVERIHT